MRLSVARRSFGSAVVTARDSSAQAAEAIERLAQDRVAGGLPDLLVDERVELAEAGRLIDRAGQLWRAAPPVVALGSGRGARPPAPRRTAPAAAGPPAAPARRRRSRRCPSRAALPPAPPSVRCSNRSLAPWAARRRAPGRPGPARPAVAPRARSDLLISSDRSSSATCSAARSLMARDATTRPGGHRGTTEPALNRFSRPSTQRMLEDAAMRQIADDVWHVPLAPRDSVNAYILGDVLVDAGHKVMGGEAVMAAARARGVTSHALDPRASRSRRRLAAGDPRAGARRAGRRRARRPRRPRRWQRAAATCRGAAAGHPARLIGRFPARRRLARELRDGDLIGPGFVVLDVPGHSPLDVAFWRESTGC